MIFDLYVNVMPLKALLDPRGKATHQGLHNLGFDAVQQVRIGKRILLRVEAPGPETALELARQAAQKLLANPVMEEFTVELATGQPA